MRPKQDLGPAYEVLSSGKDIDLSYQASSRISKIVFSAIPERKLLTLAFSCGARSVFNREGIRLLEKHAIAPSAARLCWTAR
jgi:hypothetical protein